MVVPVSRTGESSRCELIQWSPTEFIQSLQGLSTARGCRDPLSDVLRCFLDVWNEVLQPGGENCFSGCSRSSRRWVKVSATFWINRRVPAACGIVGERFWKLKMAGGGLETKYDRRVDF